MASDQIEWRVRGASSERGELASDININRAYRPGISVEQVRISKPQELAFRYQGHTHYLALHDIVRTDGETTIDGFARSVRRDIRNTLTFVPKGLAVEGWSKFKDRRSSVLAIFFDPNADECELRADDLPPRLHFENPSLKESVQKLGAEMSVLLAHEQTYAEHLSVVILCELRDALLGKREAPTVRGGIAPQKLSRLRDYIITNLAKDISLSELAALVNLSRYHFIRAFKKTTGIAPCQFVLSQRIERAKELLAEPNDSSVAAVARSVGFHRTQQLDRAFHRLTGMTPSVYRDQVADNQSKFRRQEPANTSNPRAHPENLDSPRDICCCETPQQGADHDVTGECSAGAGKMFEVASQAAIAADPREGPVNDLSLRQDLEASSGGSVAEPSGLGQPAKDYQAAKNQFCVQCGLCVRYCALIKQKNAIGFVDRGPAREIRFIPEVASEVCLDCKECFPLCPTSTLQEAFDLMRSRTS